MPRRLSVTVERFPLREPFRIARGVKTEAAVVTCEIADEYGRGWAECVPYPRYGEDIESVINQIEGVRPLIERGGSRASLERALAAGAARNALDCALWDLEAKSTGGRVAAIVCGEMPRPVETAYTISLDSAEAMASAARASGRGLLKIKLGTDDDRERIRAIRAAARGARLILDANEGWTAANIKDHLLAAAAAGAVLVEQPLPAGEDGVLRDIPHPVPICADESLHVGEDLDHLVGLYDYVNVKLDKTGGLTEAVRLIREARSRGFGLMVGCMVGSSLAMAPALLIAQHADVVDLDGPLLLAKDRPHPLHYYGSLVSPPDPVLWG
ncbi:N-acetyl-D-Glu racemase DgcA [Aurantimonas sp. 22II-16-19i]|uniref:N-acetyl-D-Glu racemase DgcA n=1 Tax=Aurantimonas sp. 22II-16-19i TaxID=1317114 RepID=UPI0009F7B0B0|nr:N-acetyl-D-Glu racemase DgcA [Aurantimonas sp. 22II-16-19i]ORE89679.1 putative muconate cycloisomerase [Aurantimonas sp. 22II-16-19i]